MLYPAERTAEDQIRSVQLVKQCDEITHTRAF